MKIESSEFEHGRVYFKQFGAGRVNETQQVFFYLRVVTNVSRAWRKTVVTQNLF